MIRRRDKNTGLPWRVYERFGKRWWRIWYQPPKGKRTTKSCEIPLDISRKSGYTPSHAIDDRAAPRVSRGRRDEMLMIRNRTTGETIPLVRDVGHAHPDWVHEQCETESESELQGMIDQAGSGYQDNPGKPDVCGIFEDTNPIAALVADLPADAAVWVHDLAPQPRGSVGGDWLDEE